MQSRPGQPASWTSRATMPASAAAGQPAAPAVRRSRPRGSRRPPRRAAGPARAGRSRRRRPGRTPAPGASPGVGDGTSSENTVRRPRTGPSGPARPARCRPGPCSPRRPERPARTRPGGPARPRARRPRRCRSPGRCWPASTAGVATARPPACRTQLSPRPPDRARGGGCAGPPAGQRDQPVGVDRLRTGRRVAGSAKSPSRISRSARPPPARSAPVISRSRRRPVLIPPRPAAGRARSSAPTRRDLVQDRAGGVGGVAEISRPRFIGRGGRSPRPAERAEPVAGQPVADGVLPGGEVAATSCCTRSIITTSPSGSAGPGRSPPRPARSPLWPAAAWAARRRSRGRRAWPAAARCSAPPGVGEVADDDHGPVREVLGGSAPAARKCRRIVNASSRAWVGCSWVPSPALSTAASMPSSANHWVVCHGAPEAWCRITSASTPIAATVSTVSAATRPWRPTSPWR